MQGLTKRYEEGSIFHPRDIAKVRFRAVKQAYKPEPQPAIQLRPFISAESLDTAIDPAVSRLISTLLKKNETRFMEGLYWYRVPESLYEQYTDVNRQRANHIRDVFEFAWSRYPPLSLTH